MQKWLEGLVQCLEVSVIVMDDLAAYRLIAQRLLVGHQFCQFHAKRWVGKALRGLRNTIPQEWLLVLDEIEELIETFPPERDKPLVVIWRQIPARCTGPARALTTMQ